MRDQGVVIHNRTELQSIASGDGGLTARTKRGEDIDVDRIMYATGRRPLTRDMGLTEAGVTLHEDGTVAVDDVSRSSVPNIYAIGDCTDRIDRKSTSLNSSH